MNLDEWNCSGDDAIQLLFDLTVEQRQENLNLNPVEFSHSDLKDLLGRVCSQ